MATVSATRHLGFVPVVGTRVSNHGHAHSCTHGRVASQDREGREGRCTDLTREAPANGTVVFFLFLSASPFLLFVRFLVLMFMYFVLSSVARRKSIFGITQRDSCKDVWLDRKVYP